MPRKPRPEPNDDADQKPQLTEREERDTLAAFRAMRDALIAHLQRLAKQAADKPT